MKFRFKVEGADTIINIDDHTYLTLEPSAVRQVIAALRECEKLASEYEQAERIINDSALLMRTGAPFTLTGNRKMLDLAKVEAVHNRELRRYLPGGVKSREVFGVPTIIQLKGK